VRGRDYRTGSPEAGSRSFDCHRELASPLLKAEVACHRFVIGELACGFIRNRNEVLSFLRSLPSAVEADHDEVMDFGDRLLVDALGGYPDSSGTNGPARSLLSPI
jgi:hypothetical protein